jgi:hypothetical protein
MHNSDDPQKETAMVRIYLDESGDEGPSITHAVIGGLLINRSYFLHFEAEWDRLLEKHGIAAPIHMKEFGRPHGRFASMSDVCRYQLFVEAADLINSHKLFSIGSTLSNHDYQTHMPQAVRDKYSVYAMCFMLTAVANHKLAELSNYRGNIPFILDSGNAYAKHVRQAHAVMLEWQHQGVPLNVGSLTFADDADFGVLQAADMIAWGVRRRVSGIPFGDIFTPIETILNDEKNHAEQEWKADWLKQLGERILRRIEAKTDE